MKLPDFLCPSRSIAVRLTWRVVGTLLIITLILSGLFFLILSIGGLVVLSALYIANMSAMEMKMDNVFTAVEVAVSNRIPEIEKNIDSGGQEYMALEQLLQLNPNLIGAAMALNPECEPKRGKRYAPYAYRDSIGIKTKNLDSPQYDYLYKEWYTKPLDEGKAIWTEPYVDEGGGEVMMITYSTPLANSKGEIYAVQTADISLDWLSELILDLDSIYNDEYYMGMEDRGGARSFIVTANGNFVVHPDKVNADGETIYDYLNKNNYRSVGKSVEEILNNNTFMTVLIGKSANGQFVFIKKIKQTGWTIVAMVPFKDLLQPVSAFVLVFIFVLVIALLIVGLVCRINIHKVTRPLTQFARSAVEIADGNLETPLPEIKSKDEMLTLHDSFSTMQRSLVSQIEQIKKANEEKGRIEGELLIARNIQMSMLPQTFPAFPERNDMDIYALLTPAKEVGGDLYDFLIRDEKLYFCIGDVSGKGMPAAMVMAVIRALFRTASSHDSNPGKIAAGINEMVAEDNDSNMFVTLFVGVLDLPSGRLRYCNAGHNPPLIINGSEVSMMACDPNLPLGIMDNWKFTTQEIFIEPQTTVFLYTDGVTEAENARFEQFQEQRMIEVSRQTHQQPQTLIKEMEKKISEFVGDAPQSDDMTMMAIQYTKQHDQQALLQKSITLSNDVEQVPQLSAFVEEVCEEVQVDMSTVMSINLAIEEAVVNVMNYAYPTGTVGEILIEAKADNRNLLFVITDWGKPFDPTTQEDIDTTLPAEDRLIGGLGIHLVRQIMDSINYERIGGKNVLSLNKKVN